MTNTERYIVCSRAGQQVIRTKSLSDAERWQKILGGEIKDRDAS